VALAEETHFDEFDVRTVGESAFARCRFVERSKLALGEGRLETRICGSLNRCRAGVSLEES
jgi:hypothetical protein